MTELEFNIYIKKMDMLSYKYRFGKRMGLSGKTKKKIKTILALFVRIEHTSQHTDSKP